MAKTILMKAYPREIKTKGYLKSLRANKNIPGIIYGGDGPAIPVYLSEKEFFQTLHQGLHENMVISLNIEGQDKTENIIVKEIQKDFWGEKILNIDLMRISLTEKIEVEVPIKIVGESIGVKNKGGVIDIVSRTLLIKCLANEIPPEIEINISSLDIGDSLRVKDLKLPSKIEVVDAADKNIVSIVPPVKEEVTEAAPTLTEEPEVIKKERKEPSEEE